MSKVKESLEANLENIRSQLPDDLKQHAESCLDNCDIEHDDIELVKQQILHELPDEVKELVDEASLISAPEKAPSLDEQKIMVREALADEFHADFEKTADNELVES